MNILKELDTIELMAVLTAYDDYIQDANDGDRYSDGFKPVCISEFYMNDFEHWKDDI